MNGNDNSKGESPMPEPSWLVAAAIVALAAPAAAQAQPAEGTSAATDAADHGEIIVTATRRSQALSEVPIAISAVTAETLRNSGASDIRQLNQVSPSLLVSSTQSEAGAGVARIRGIGTVGDNPGLESSVAVFIDGVYRNRSGVGLTELGAIDRIEVLRGPQGTLFGRNASAGLIHVITARPQFEFGGTAEATYGNYDYMRGVVGLTGPVADTLAFRIDGVYAKRDGFLKDVISGRDLNDRDRYLVRGQLLYEPSDTLSVRLIADYSERDEECCGATYLPARNVSRNPDGSLAFAPSVIAGIERANGGTIIDDTFARKTAITPGRSYRSDVRDYGFSGEVNWDLGGPKLTSISSYRDWRFIRGQDADFNSLDILYRGDDGSANQKFRTFTQELRLQGEAFDGRLDWLVGGYYAREKLIFNDNLTYGADFEKHANCLTALNFAAGARAPSLVSPTSSGCLNPAVVTALLANPAVPAALKVPLGLFGGRAIPGLFGYDALAAAAGLPGFQLDGVALRDHYEQTSRNYAFFTHNVFEVTDRLSVTIGARYTNERKTLDATLVDNSAFCRAVSASAALRGLQTLPCVTPGVSGGSFTETGERRSEDEWTYTGVISYKPIDDLLLYASYSKGYKAGGFNLDRNGLNRVGRTLYTDGSTLINGTGAIDSTADLSQLEFEAEGVHAVELGAKYNGRGFDLNVTAFHQVFDNFQLNTFTA